MECQTQSSIDLRPANVVGVDGAASDEVPLSVLHGERQLTVQTPATKWRGIVHCGVRARMTRGIGRDGRAGAELGPVRRVTCAWHPTKLAPEGGCLASLPSRGSRGWVSRFPCRNPTRTRRGRSHGNQLDLWAAADQPLYRAAVDLCQRPARDVPWVRRWWKPARRTWGARQRVCRPNREEATGIQAACLSEARPSNIVLRQRRLS